MINTREYNNKRFSIFESEEKTALELMNELGEHTNFNAAEIERTEKDYNEKIEKVTKDLNDKDIEINNKLNNKTPLHGDHRGTWCGLSPTQTDIGLSSTVDKLSKNMEDIFSKSSFKSKLKKSSNFYGEKQIIVFGDSISWGSMVADKVKDSWVGILRKAINLEYDNRNYGFENFYPDQLMSDNITVMRGKHTITHNDFINQISNNNIGCYKYSSNVVEHYIEFTTDGENKLFSLCYNQFENGGNLDIYVNDKKVGSVSTHGAKVNSMKSLYFKLTNGSNRIKIVKTDNYLTELIGVFYTNDNSLKTLQNFSRSGSKLFEIENEVLDIVASGDILIMALGHNDSGYDKIEEFTNKLNYLAYRCKQWGTYVIVPDFIWYKTDKTIQYKNELKRFAEEVNGIYIDFAKHLNFSTPEEAINNGFLMDYSHPSKKGMEIIADTVINALGLGNKGKNNISDKHKDTDWVVIEDTELKNGYTNAYNIDKYKFKYRRKGGSVEVVLLLNTNGAVSGTEIYQLPLGFRPFLNTEVITQVSGNGINKLLISEGGNISYYPTGTFTTIAGSFSFPCYE